MPCALVLSAGGMFGAYQAGDWNVLSQRSQPDLVVGTSSHEGCCAAATPRSYVSGVSDGRLSRRPKN
jgi:hypothetical protein